MTYYYYYLGKNVTLIISKNQQTSALKTPLELAIQKLGANTTNQKTNLESTASKVALEISQNKKSEVNGQKEVLDSSNTKTNVETANSKAAEESSNAKTVLDSTHNPQKETIGAVDNKLTKELNDDKKVQIKTPSEVGFYF